jgi:hypothetical protein
MLKCQKCNKDILEPGDACSQNECICIPQFTVKIIDHEDGKEKTVSFNTEEDSRKAMQMVFCFMDLNKKLSLHRFVNKKEVHTITEWRSE